MITQTPPFLIIGSGLAGYNAAREIRKHDKTTPLLIITEEDGAYYSKPSLSTAMSQGKSAEDLMVHSAEQMAAQLNATILTHTSVLELCPKEHTVRIEGQTIAYKACVLAMGATPYPLPVEGTQAGVIQVNTRQDYGHLCERLKGCQRVVILGAGLIGTEFANDLSKQKFEVTLVSRSSTPLNHLMPPPAGQAIIDTLRDQGAHFVGGTTATAIEAVDGGGYLVTLGNGEQYPADLILSAIGLSPNIDLAKRAGLETNRGICTNRLLQTSDLDVYTTGDCAEIAGTLLQFVMPLMHQSRSLGATITGTPTPLVYPCMPVSVKASCHVTVVIPCEKGTWQVEGTSPDFKAICTNDAGSVIGWALTGARTTERRDLSGLVPGILTA